MDGGVLGLMKEQKGLEVFKGLGEGGGGGWWRDKEGDRRGTGGAGKGSGAQGGVTGSSVTCPPLTKAICCRERERRWGGKEQTLGKKMVKRGKKGADVRSKFVFRILVLISISYCAQACPFF